VNADSFAISEMGFQIRQECIESELVRGDVPIGYWEIDEE
jgi:hypothetical protein